MLPINHLKRTLDRCCGQWEFLSHSDSDLKPFEAVVKHLNTGEIYLCLFDGERWDAEGSSPFLTNRLNGHTRDDAGNVFPSPGDGYRWLSPTETIEKGDEYLKRDGTYAPCWLSVSQVAADCIGPVRRKIVASDPLYETPDKVVL